MLMTILLLSVLLLVTAAAAAATAARLGEATPVVVAMGEDPTSASGGADVPSWDDLDRRPLPPWYDSAKFGIFIHWGVFSVPSFTSEWFWNYWHEPGDDVRSAAARFVKETEAPGFVYQEYANRFRAELYNASDWAQVFAASGAQYVVLTSKHHEGFAMWNSTPNVPATWNWNAVDVGPKRDVLGELAEAVKRSKSPHTSNLLKFGVYHSLYVDLFCVRLISNKNVLNCDVETFPASGNSCRRFRYFLDSYRILRTPLPLGNKVRVVQPAVPAGQGVKLHSSRFRRLENHAGTVRSRRAVPARAGVE
jgi:alpha-L-fucosidase